MALLLAGGCAYTPPPKPLPPNNTKPDPVSHLPKEAARITLDRAIKAHGGEANLARLRVARIKSTITGMLPGVGEMDLQVVDTLQLPNQIKKDIKGHCLGKELSLVWAINRDRWWYQEGQGEIKEMEGNPDSEKEYHPFAVWRQLLQAREEGHDLSALGETQVEGQALIGVRDTAGQLTQSYYFDATTGLLHRVTSNRPIRLYFGKEVAMETVFQDYQEVDGVRLPMKHITYHDGKRAIEVSVVEVKLFDRLDDSVFAKP
jgi:hypothetical protein